MDSIVQPQCDDGVLNCDKDHFHLPKILYAMVYLVRFEGRWFRISPKPFEPERMTTDIAWLQIKEGLTPAEAYRRWFEDQRRISRLLQQ